MEIKESRKKVMLAEEAFIRRASIINQPFMLKGSYVTRQYFANPLDRIPADVDWVYMLPITDPEMAYKTFNEWAQAITDLDLKDGVEFRSFARNPFWRYIDYAMADDFPTVNTDLLCWVNGEDIEISIDISFNLDFGNQSDSLNYQSLSGHDFTITHSVPLSYQIAWKIHQTLVRPRFKDLFDLMHLVTHSSFNHKLLESMLQVLIDECYVDGVSHKKIHHFLSGDFGKLFPFDNPIEMAWMHWRHGTAYYCEAKALTNVENLPTELTAFINNVINAFTKAGLGTFLMAHLPSPSIKK